MHIGLHEPPGEVAIGTADTLRVLISLIKPLGDLLFLRGID